MAKRKCAEMEGDPQIQPEGQNDPPKKKASEIAPSLHWCFTWHFEEGQPWDESAIQTIKTHPKLAGGIIGRETCPTTQRKHLQGYVEFKVKSRPFSLGLPKVVSWRKARGSGEENHKYCSKEDPNYEVWGTCEKHVPFTEEIPELYPWQLELLEILQKKPDKRTIVWLFCDEGGSGKTTFIKHFLTCYPQIEAIVSGGKAADVQNQVADLRENKGVFPKVIFYNIPRSFKADYLCWHAIESLKDMCFYSGKYKGGMIVGPCPHLVIFANERPDETKLSMDRWKMGKIVDKKIDWYVALD